MLVISRKKNESIIFGDDIVVTVVEIRGDKVRLGVSASANVPVHRNEVYEAIRGRYRTSRSDESAAASRSSMRSLWTRIKSLWVSSKLYWRRSSPSDRDNRSAELDPPSDEQRSELVGTPGFKPNADTERATKRSAVRMKKRKSTKKPSKKKGKAPKKKPKTKRASKRKPK